MAIDLEGLKIICCHIIKKEHIYPKTTPKDQRLRLFAYYGITVTITPFKKRIYDFFPTNRNLAKLEKLKFIFTGKGGTE